MCDGRYYEEFLAEWACPYQPWCDLCWKLAREEAKQEYIDTIARLVQKAFQPSVVIEPPTKGEMPQGAKSIYELTMTTTKDDPYELRQYLQKIVDSSMFEVMHYEACIELQKNGMPHIHAIIYSAKKYCDGSKIKYPKGINYPYRYEFKRVRNHDNYLNYMKKDLSDNITKEYCTVKGIPQYWKKDGGS